MNSEVTNKFKTGIFLFILNEQNLKIWCSDIH